MWYICHQHIGPTCMFHEFKKHFPGLIWPIVHAVGMMPEGAVHPGLGQRLVKEPFQPLPIALIVYFLTLTGALNYAGNKNLHREHLKKYNLRQLYGILPALFNCQAKSAIICLLIKKLLS